MTMTLEGEKTFLSLKSLKHIPITISTTLTTQMCIILIARRKESFNNSRRMSEFLKTTEYIFYISENFSIIRKPNPTTTPTIKNNNNNNGIANENETNILSNREIIGNNQDVSYRVNNNNNEKLSHHGYYDNKEGAIYGVLNGKPEVNYRYLNQKQQGLPPLNHVRNCNSNEKVHHPLKLYTIKDYKEIKKTFDYIKGIEKGGLGPSIKNDQWLERKKLVEKMMRFSHDVKVINTSKIAKFLEESVSKEKSSYNKNLNTSTRQKAWEFARNIDPPKIKKKKQDFETILEKDDLEDTLEYYEQKHRDLAKKLEKNKGKKN